MKKKIIGIGSAVILIVAGFGLGFCGGVKTYHSEFPILKYAKEKNYSIASYKNGIITKKETAEKIGEAVLIEKNLRGDKPIDVTYDEKNEYWRVDGIQLDDRSDRVYSILIRRDGLIVPTTCKK